MSCDFDKDNQPPAGWNKAILYLVAQNGNTTFIDEKHKAWVDMACQKFDITGFKEDKPSTWFDYNFATPRDLRIEYS